MLATAVVPTGALPNARLVVSVPLRGPELVSVTVLGALVEPKV
jgi:hypothetical protein